MCVWNNKDSAEEEEVGLLGGTQPLTAGRGTDPDTRLMLTMPIILLVTTMRARMMMRSNLFEG